MNAHAALLCQIALERGPHLRAGTVQQHPLVGLAQLQQRRTSPDEKPSTSRSRITSRCAGGSCSIAASITDRVSAPSSVASGRPSQPRGGEAQAPAAGLPAAGTGRDRRRGRRRRRQRRERDAPPLALRPRLGGVGEDPVDPRAQRGAALEPVDPAQHAQPGLLHDVLGDRARPHVHHGDAHQRRPDTGRSAPRTRPRHARAAPRPAAARPAKGRGHAGGAGGSAMASTILPESGVTGGSLRRQRAGGRRHSQRQRGHQAEADRARADRDQPAPAGVQPQPRKEGAQRAAEVVERQVQAGGRAPVMVDQPRDQQLADGDGR